MECGVIGSSPSDRLDDYTITVSEGCTELSSLRKVNQALRRGLNSRIGFLEICYCGLYCPFMEIEPCEVCERGIGHCSNMVGYDNDPERGKICIIKCRTCHKTLTFDSTDEEECCEHRYVGEDLFQSEAYYGQHDNPEDF